MSFDKFHHEAKADTHEEDVKGRFLQRWGKINAAPQREACCVTVCLDLLWDCAALRKAGRPKPSNINGNR